MMRCSVIIPAFNAGETIAKTLQSVIMQTRPDWEVIVINDGSTDHTAAIVEAFVLHNNKIRLISQENAGLSAARNAGIAVAKFDHLLFLDADDWISPEYLSAFNDVFEAEPETAAVVCGWQFVLENGEAVDEKYPP